ncbi:uncharacterized protein LOC126985324 [Eriocheir sinensis]|uniref:uncharacterized protein LOC126985324 n=1 Tax=Eriocheir sinensis TaxID=95602 RepID=UPI0021C8646E|nr:uncharacterized protein LOC126985324 [Eriocheir sinensis]
MVTHIDGGGRGDRGGGGRRRNQIPKISLSLLCLFLLAAYVPTGAEGVENDVRAFLDSLDHFETKPGSYKTLNGQYEEMPRPSSPDDDLNHFLYQSLMNTDLGGGKVRTVGDLMAETNDLLEKGHLVLRRRFTEEAHRYNKAVRNVSSVVVTDAPVTSLTLEEHPPTLDWSLHVTALHLHTHAGQTYLLLGSFRSRDQRVVVWSSHSGTLRTLAKFQITDISIEKVDKTASHIYDGTLYIVLGSSQSRLVRVVCIGVSTGKVMLPEVLSLGGVVGALHLFVASDQLFLVIGESHKIESGDGLGRSEIYMLVGELFDKQETLVMFGSSGVRDITSFSASWGTTYIVLGMYSAEGSQVYALDTESKMYFLTLQQELETETKVVRLGHFRDQADLRHFVVVLSEGAPSAVYWWNGYQLAQWQTLQTPEMPSLGGGGVSLAILPLPNFEHLIFASAGPKITAYTYHTTGNHDPSFIVTTECSAVKDLAAAAVGPDFVLVYVCEGPVSRVEARIVHLEALMEGREDMMGQQESQLSACLDGLRGILESRKPYVAALKQVVDTDALMTVDHAQVWSGPITVPELWVGQTSTLQHTVVIPPEGVTGANQSRGEYEALLARLQAEVREVQASLGSVLYYAGEQTIRNPVLGASLFATTAQFDVVSVHKLHGVTLTSLANEVLLDGPDQVISGHWQFVSLAAQRFTTRSQHPPGSINGVQTADYMRKSVAGQVVSGRHTYHTLTAGRVCHITGCGLTNPLTVNGLSTAAIVRQRQDVTFTARKTFARLIVREALEVAAINGISLGQVLGQAVFTDVAGTLVLSGRHSIRKLTVGGNLNVGTVNGVNVADLEKAMVRRRGDYRLTGSLVYKNRLMVTGNNEARVVNGVPWGELLPLNAPVTVSGAYTFARATINAALRSDSINGLDLSRDVVLTDAEQTIEGRIRFLESVQVTGSAGVRMAEGATINGIDPSEVATGGNLGGGGGGVVTVVVEHEMKLTVMHVKGNVVIPSVNGVNLGDLAKLFWRKSVAQEINVPVHIREAVFLGGVEGSTLNGHALTEYLQLNANQRITGRYSFEGSVKVAGNIVVAEGRTVAGVDVSTLPARLITVDEPQTLEVEVRFSGRVTVVGDVDLHGDFSGLHVLTRALRLDQTIPHTGRLTFAGGALMSSLQVTSSDLTVTSINGLDVAAAASDLVLVDQDATITGGGGVRFSGDVNIRELHVSGLVDGVDIARMLSRALRTTSHTPQVVSAALTVERDVHFAHGLTLARVNGEDWTTYLGNVVQVGFKGRIEGRKLFTGGLRVSGNLQAGSINGVDLGALASRILRKSSHQVISGHYTFLGDVTADVLDAPVIDGVVMDNLALVGGGAQLGGTVTFAEDVTLLAGLTADSNVLDSCDFSRIQTGPVVGGDGQSLVDIPGMEIDTLVVERRTFLSSFASITTTSNIDISRLLHSLVLKSTDQVITGSVRFLNDVRVGELSAAVVDGVDVQALFTQAVLRGQDVVIECDLHLTEGLQVGRLEVGGDVEGADGAGVLVNGVDLSAVAGRAVLMDGRTYVVRGRKVFTAGLATTRLRAVSLAGVSVQDLVVVGGAVNRPPPRLAFRGPVAVLGDLWVTGLVDGVDLARLFSERVTMNGHQTLVGSYHFEALRVEGDITTTSINNVSISDLVLRAGQARQVIVGAKLLAGGLLVGGGLRVATLNGVDVTKLNRTIVTLNQGAATVRVDVRFEGSVRCLAGTEVTGTVNGHDLSVLAQRVSQIQHRLAQEQRRIADILGQFGSLNADNYIKARELYAEMASLERIFLPRETDAYGMMWWGAVPGVTTGHVLRISSCHVLLCGCDRENQYFVVGNDTSLTPVPHLSSGQAITTHQTQDGQHLLSVHSQCVGGDSMQVKVTLAHRSSAPLMLQGLLVDCAMFQADGEEYLVMALYRNSGDEAYGSEAETEMVVVRVAASSASLHVVTRWQTKALVVDLDVTRAGDTWFLLLANSYGYTSVDKYVTTSEILRWDSSSRQFRAASEHLASHVSSGSFVQVMGETFLVLAQGMAAPPKQTPFAASCSSKVLVYRYNKATRHFVESQSIAAFGVVSQTTVRVDRSVYLILASPSKHCLYVCVYKHSEGFVITSQVFLVSPLSVVSVAAGEDMYVLVSTVSGVERYKVFVKGVDPDSLYL